MENKLENKWTKEVEKTPSTNQQLQRKDNKDKWGNKKHSSEESSVTSFLGEKKKHILKKIPNKLYSRDSLQIWAGKWETWILIRLLDQDASLNASNGSCWKRLETS